MKININEHSMVVYFEVTSADELEQAIERLIKAASILWPEEVKKRFNVEFGAPAEPPQFSMKAMEGSFCQTCKNLPCSCKTNPVDETSPYYCKVCKDLPCQCHVDEKTSNSWLAECTKCNNRPCICNSWGSNFYNE